MGWLITLAVLTALAMIPVGVSLLYEKGIFLLKLKVAFLRFDLNLGKKKKEPKIKKSDPDPVLSPEEESLNGQKGALKTALSQRRQAKQEAAEAERRAKEAEKKLAEARKAQEKAQEKPATPPQQKAPEQPVPQEPEKKKEKTDLTVYLPFVRLALDLLGSLRKKLRIQKLHVKAILAGTDPCDLATAYGRTWAGAMTLMGHINQIFVVEDQDIDIQCDFTAEKLFISVRMDLTITVGRMLSLAVCYGVRALREFLIFKKRKGGAAI